METRKTILVVEDESSICHIIRAILEAAGYDVLIATEGTAAYAAVESSNPDLILLDLGLPDMDGMEFLRMLRCWSQTPVIVVSARREESDKVQALEKGADDYIAKPFGSQELLARVRVALRHADMAAADAEQTDYYRVGDLLIDYAKYRVYVNGVDVKLTQSEFKIVGLLGRHSGRVLTYEFIIRYIWGPNAVGCNQILRVNMANIRRKIEKSPASPRYILTEVGVGYMIAEE